MPITEINPDFLNATQRYETIPADDLQNGEVELQGGKENVSESPSDKHPYTPWVL
ncbi:hypothetical protein [Legionella longbeachae]|uniref:Uncharacterized protein n=1 Tax=Legionella longbeachae serogroup 1 (strain NSW150) TaxID=661367 RepID=D3HMV0_LEGLN|nr:hypothetical protein [Legionella longbeachae]EEZ96802.1 hypothetical protein LLB_2000 [Legionella longbeachae D-4968]UAK47237.1 hypothetical protein K8O86_03325 [Legionella longbeachae]CBJ13796.1 protein of unknown function [Legionella longbeachae NSW150]HBD7397072.1 hypothetical protein [Legionella pneumophila]